MEHDNDWDVSLLLRWAFWLEPESSLDWFGHIQETGKVVPPEAFLQGGGLGNSQESSHPDGKGSPEGWV